MTPRPITRVFDVGSMGELKVRREKAGNAEAQPDGTRRPSELVETLERVRSKIDAQAQVFASSPSQSKADVTHLAGLAFDAPPAKEWLKSKGVEDEENLVGDLLADSLKDRGHAPEHAPTTQEEAALEGCPSEQEQQDDLLRRYPRPAWLELDELEGTMNIGVVGNSGVGKSLLINRMRGLQHFDEGWAPVGIDETTTSVSMYAFPRERRVRFWDFPGAGTPMFPLETYVARMGLRYLDSVIIVTAGRFTQTEVQLMHALSEFKVPYHMVRTKVDIDVMNNLQDNSVSEPESVSKMRKFLREQHGIENTFLVSLRDVNKYDFQKLVAAVFPCLAEQPALGQGWDDAWALPEVYGPVVEAIQGTWKDSKGNSYIVKAKAVHVTNFLLGCSETSLKELPDGSVEWCEGYGIDSSSITLFRSTEKLTWTPKPSHPKLQPLEWFPHG